MTKQWTEKDVRDLPAKVLAIAESRRRVRRAVESRPVVVHEVPRHTGGDAR